MSDADDLGSGLNSTADTFGTRLKSLLPQKSDYAGLSQTYRSDIVAGITVGVVALPLALAFGITAGMTAEAGLVTAIIAGFVAAVFGGSNVQVSGPTGAMAVVLLPIVARYGMDAVFVVALLAGVVVVIAGLVGLGRYLVFIPWPVIEGFTLGIGVIIFLQQVPAAVGVTKPEGENTVVVAAKAIADAVGGPGSLWAVVLAGLVVMVMWLGPRVHGDPPWSLLAVIIATLVARFGGADVSVIGELPSNVITPLLPSIEFGVLPELAGAVLAVAALAGLESLLSAKVADGMAGTGRHDPNRELFGQGLANVASAFFGGMPATGAIARTAVNVKAGAHTRVASVVHALVLLGVVLVGSGLVAQIPLAALAGVLMMTAIRMVDIDNVGAVVRATRSDAIVLFVTAFVTIAFDLILAVGVGMAAAALLVLRKIARTELAVAEPLPRLDQETADALRHDRIVSYRLDGALFFGAVQRFLVELAMRSDVEVVIFRLPDLQVLDASGAQAFGEVIEELEGRGITVLLKGPRPEHLRVLENAGAISRLAHERHLFHDLDEAITHARRHVERGGHPHAEDPPEKPEG